MTEKSLYAQAGVDFEKEHDVVNVMVTVGRETRKNVQDLEKIGISFPEEGSDFSGSYQIDLENMVKSGVKKIINSGGVDGPGTKPVVHALYDGTDPIKKATTAIDSILMCTNDVICAGARPIVILEYHSWHDTNLQVAKEMAVGKVIAAELSKAAIIGGENASLSAMITGPKPSIAYDMCNMAMGIITNEELIKNPLGKRRVKEGDVAIGLSSSGLHCNGATLIWKTAIGYNDALAVFKDGFAESYIINRKVEELGESVAEAILTPTIAYIDPILKAIDTYGNGIKAVANITGEGIHNMKRVLPETLGLKLDYSAEDVQQPHPIFNWVQKTAGVDTREMYENYNMGTGMVVIVDKNSADCIIGGLNNMGDTKGKKYAELQRFKAYKLGEVVLDSEKPMEIKAFDKTMHSYK